MPALSASLTLAKNTFWFADSRNSMFANLSATWRSAVFIVKPGTSFTRPVSTNRPKNQVPSTALCQP